MDFLEDKVLGTRLHEPQIASIRPPHGAAGQMAQTPLRPQETAPERDTPHSGGGDPLGSRCPSENPVCITGTEGYRVDTL